MVVATAPPRRGAERTRGLLLDAAKRQFAAKGYASTTVREIADEAGVNVSLINRYFGSKTGLFEACLLGVSTELGTSARAATLEEVAARIAGQIVGPSAAHHPNQLVLLLRTSGDEGAEKIRLDTLGSYAESLRAVAASWSAGPEDEHAVLRAQLVLSAALGIAVLRSWTALEPLSSVAEADLVGPVTALLTALLGPGAGDDRPDRHAPDPAGR